MGLDVDPQNKEYQVQSIKPRPARTAPLLEAEEAAAPRESAQSPRILSAQVKDFETSQEKPSQTTPVRTQRRPGDLGKPAVEQTGPDSPNVTIIEATPPDRLRSGSEASPIKSMEAAEQYESQPPAGLTASPVKTPQESQEAEASSQKRLAPAQLRQDEAGRPEVERTGKLIQQAAFQPAARPADRPAQKIKSFELLEATVDSSPTAAQQQGLGRAPRDEGEAFLNPVELLRSSTAAAMGAPEGLRRTAPASVSLEAPVWDTRSSLVIPARNQTRMQAIAPEEAFSSGKAAPGTDKGIGTATDMTASSNYAPENRIKTEVAPAGPPEKSSSPAYSTKMSQFTKVQPAQMEASGKKWLQSFPATKPDQRAEDNVPIIRVSIGRVVVRGSLPQAKAQSHPQAEESQPSLSLDDYLKNSRRRV
jgi:hypothetical protein